MSSDAIAVAAVLATLLGSIGVIGQIVVTRRQLVLQEAATYRDQADAWRALSFDWQTVLIAGYGPVTARAIGMDVARCDAYEAVLAEYRDARLHWHDVTSREAEANESEGVDTWERSARAQAALDSYRSAVRNVLVYLAQLSDLVLRRRLSVRSLYDAVGHDLIRDASALRTVARLPYDSIGCPGPMHHEIEVWRTLTLDEISGRVGWASSLSEATGAAARIHLLLDLMIFHGQAVGDSIWRGPETLADEVNQPDNISLRWKTASRVSLRAALGLAWRSSGVGTRAVYESAIRRITRNLAWKLCRPKRFATTVIRGVRASNKANNVYLPPIELKPGTEEDHLDLRRSRALVPDEQFG